MFQALYENFADTNTTIQSLNTNIARYQSVEPNYTIMNSQNNYPYPNTGAAPSAQLQAALNSLGSTSVPGTTSGAIQPTSITNLGSVLTGVSDDIGTGLKNCRKFEGLTGLSNLMKSQTDPAATQRCGWRYKAGIGAVPQAAQGAYGTRSGPLDPARPQVDRVDNGIQYYWDLAAAEKQMVKDICKSATSCVDMTAVPLSAVGDFSNVCGYCETSKKIIPIKNQNGVIMPRYNDVDTQCSPEKIITVNDAKTRCPPPPPGAPEAPAYKCLNMGKLDRDCITLAALYAGCSPQGTFVSALTKGKNNQDYGDILRNEKSFQAYQQLSSAPISQEMIKDGNATIFSAFYNVYQMNRNMYNTDNEKRRIAAQDLCTSPGLFDSYNFCADLKDGDKDFEVKCMQQYFLQSGGSLNGTDYPTTDKLSRLKGTRTWGQYKASVNNLKVGATSSDPMVQRESLNKLSGLGLTMAPTNLPRGEASQGVELFYFDQSRRTFLGRRAQQSAANKSLPSFNMTSTDIENTGLSSGLSMVYIYDLRPDTDKTIAFGCTTDDGWALARNQPVFNIKDMSSAASFWYNQGPTWHNTTGITVYGEDRKLPNIFMGAWYNAAGGAAFLPYYKVGTATYNKSGQSGWIPIGGGNTAIESGWKNMCYFTQEIDAPTLQFEPYQPKDYFSGGIHFCERRLWSTAELREYNWGKTAQQIGYVFSKPAGTNLPDGQMVMTLDSAAAAAARQWYTVGNIAGSAIRTWTVCFNIDRFGAKMGQWTDVFAMASDAGGKRAWSIQAMLKDNNTVDLALNYTGNKVKLSTSRVTINKNNWYIAVVRLHPENSSSRAIGKMSFFVQWIKNMKDGNVLMGNNVQEIQPGNEIQIFNDIRMDRRDALKPILGGGNNQDYRIHYAWVHGYDQVIETSDIDSWKKEANKTWMGRWFE